MPLINPVAIDLGFLTVRWYGIMAAFTIVGGILLGRFWANEFSISIEDFNMIALACIPSWIIGARAAYVLSNFEAYRQEPLEMLLINHGGLASQGGLILTFAVSYAIAQHMKVKFWSLADAFGPVFAMGHILIRIGNFANGELYGAPTALPFGIIFPGTSQPRHPSMLYEAAGAILVLILSMMWAKRRRFQGEVFLNALVSISILRFFVDLTRDHSSHLFGGIALSQISALLYIAAALALRKWLSKAGQIE